MGPNARHSSVDTIKGEDENGWDRHEPRKARVTEAHAVRFDWRRQTQGKTWTVDRRGHGGHHMTSR